MEPGVRVDGQDDESIPHQGIRYMTRKTAKRGFCIWGLEERPRRIKPEMLLL